MKPWIITVMAVVLGGLLSWGAWATISVTGKVPRDEWNERKQAVDEKFEKVLDIVREQGQRIEDKLDDIQEQL